LIDGLEFLLVLEGFKKEKKAVSEIPAGLKMRNTM
jgi:hypothetical protein